MNAATKNLPAAALRILIDAYHGDEFGGRYTHVREGAEGRECHAAESAIRAMGLATLALIPCEDNYDGEDPSHSAHLTPAGRAWVEANAPRGYRYTVTPSGPNADTISTVDLGFIDMETAKAKAAEMRGLINAIPAYSEVTFRLSRTNVVR